MTLANLILNSIDSLAIAVLLWFAIKQRKDK